MEMSGECMPLMVGDSRGSYRHRFGGIELVQCDNRVWYYFGLGCVWKREIWTKP